MDRRFYEAIGYPSAWLDDARGYSDADAYVAFDPAWEDPLPEIPEIPVDEILRRAARAHPDRIALSSLGLDLSYAELDRLVDRFAAALQGLGLSKGDFVVPMLPPCPQHWITFFAVSRIGATSAPLNVMLKEREIAYQVKDCGARTVITLDAFHPFFERLGEELGLENVIVTSIKDYADPDYAVYRSLEPLWNVPRREIAGTLDFQDLVAASTPAPVRVDIDPKADSPLVIYTSGTTGEPKGSISTHFNLVHNTVTHAHLCREVDRPVNFSVLPMNHTGGYMVFQLPLFHLGGTVVSRPVFDVEDCYRAIESQRVSIVFGPPTFFHALLTHPAMASYDLSSLTLCAAGAAPVTKDLREAWAARTGTPLHVGWGGTETNTMGTYSLKRKLDEESVGVPYIGEVKIQTDDGGVARRGEVGEILFRGLQLGKGYLNKPEQTAASFQADGWFRSGDAGYVDHDGFLHYVDRRKDLIIASGYNISPIEIETFLVTHPAIAEAGVIGIPHAYREETVKAFVALRPEARGTVGEADVIRFCKDNIAAYKVPTEVEFVDALPRNAMGKTLRRLLKDREAEKARPVPADGDGDHDADRDGGGR